MIRKIMICMCMLLIVSFTKTAHSEVTGENSYNVCLDECCEKTLGNLEHKPTLLYGYYAYYARDCKKDKTCAECMDNCFNELRKNNPETAAKMDAMEVIANTPTDCFIEIVKQ